MIERNIYPCDTLLTLYAAPWVAILTTSLAFERLLN